jgi:hypothetical protein
MMSHGLVVEELLELAAHEELFAALPGVTVLRDVGVVDIEENRLLLADGGTVNERVVGALGLVDIAFGVQRPDGECGAGGDCACKQRDEDELLEHVGGGGISEPPDGFWVEGHRASHGLLFGPLSPDLTAGTIGLEAPHQNKGAEAWFCPGCLDETKAGVLPDRIREGLETRDLDHGGPAVGAIRQVPSCKTGGVFDLEIM